MANELTTSLRLTAVKSGAKIDFTSSYRSDMAGGDMVQNTQLIGTSAELVPFGEITGVPQAVLIANLDATNFVEIGGDSGLTVFKLKIRPEEAIYLSLSSATLYAKADTADVSIMVLAVEA